MYECFHCGFRAVIWNGDFDLEDCGYEGVGVVHCCTCTHCGAKIEYVCKFDDEKIEEGDVSTYMLCGKSNEISK